MPAMVQPLSQANVFAKDSGSPNATAAASVSAAKTQRKPSCKLFFGRRGGWAYSLLVFFILSARTPAPVNAATLLKTLFGESHNDLRAATELARRDEVTLEQVLSMTNDATVLIPTDTAWRKHTQWLAAVLSQTGLRHRLAMGAFGTTGENLESINGRQGLVLPTLTANYIIFGPQHSDSKEPEHSSAPVVCLLDSAAPSLRVTETEPSCAAISGVLSFDGGTALLVDDIVLREQLRLELDLAGSRTPQLNTALSTLGETSIEG